MSHNVQLIVDLRRISIEKIINQKKQAHQRKHTVKVIRKWNESIYVHFFYSTIDKCRLEHFSKKQFN